MDKPARDCLIEIYYEWRNNFLTVEKFAEHHEITTLQGKVLIDLARNVVSSPHPDA